ncbi:MAG: NADH-quinone oxidoreductase subunit J [Planctomycetales bacterium]
MSFLTVALGGLGVYLLLPNGRTAGQTPLRYLGGLLATIGLALLAQQSAQAIPHLTNGIAFYVMAAVSIVSAVLMISSHNPVYSALWFALVLLTNSGLYLLQGAEFLAAATIIIYAGAIIVTFLFVIMLAQPKGTALYDRYSREPFLACVTGVILAWTLIGTLTYATRHETQPLEKRIALLGGNSTQPLSVLPTKNQLAAGTKAHPNERMQADQPHVEGLGRALFLDHYVSIEVIGVILLVAVVGAMLIASHTPRPEQTTP